MEREALRAAYTIAMPSPLRKTASKKAVEAENEELRNLLKVAGVELERNHAQMALMQRENANIRQQLHAKKTKRKRAYMTGKARLMTSEEMMSALLDDLHKKQMGELHSELKKKKHFPDIRAAIRQVEKDGKAAAEKAETKEAEKAAKAAERRAKAAEKTAEKAAKPTHFPTPFQHLQTRDSDFDEQVLDEDPIPSAIGRLPPMQDDSDNEEDLAEEETGIVSFNGHRWESRRNLEFQVVWTDGDVTWEALSNINDCAAMEEYLAHRDIDDPLRLSRRKFLINRTLKSSNE
ncbi:hypothetical protein B0H14DRAFT_3787481 [Mycena olivaceomarginata]|nr:hypothetical protein B0H14DRAFT_3787481 [Mycena olivaceomarginata]